jgi:hypothetical protein
MKLDASVLGVVQRRDAVDVQKVSSQIGAGQVIETVDGRIFRVASKIAGAGGVSFCLTTPAGSLHVTASELAAMEPLPHGIARLAHVLRFYAYNRDFTQYVNEAIKAHGLPTDPQMDWSKWLYSQFSTKGKYNEGDLDEALHEYIVNLLYEKDILSKFDRKKVKRDTNRHGGLAGKITAYLTRMFTTYRSIVERTLARNQTMVPGETLRSEKGHNLGLREKLDTPMIVPGEGGEEVNVADTLSRATKPVDPFAESSSWENVAYFRSEYGDWIGDKERPETVENVLKLFDIIINAEKKHPDEVAKSSSFAEEWMKETGKSSSYFQLIMTKLSETLQQFVDQYPELVETSLIARMIADIKSKKPTTKSKNEGAKSAPRAASLSLVAVAPSELAEIPADTGRLPHDNTGGAQSAVIILDEQPKKPNRTVAPEIPAIQHGF